jgi:hypothetical protein
MTRKDHPQAKTGVTRRATLKGTSVMTGAAVGFGAITGPITQPHSVDIPNLEAWQAKVAAPHGILPGFETRKIHMPFMVGKTVAYDWSVEDSQVVAAD